MKKIIAAAALLSALPIGPASAQYSYCSQPMAPSGYLSKPSKPFCATMRNCSDFEVTAYKNDVERYFNQLKRYANEVEEYYSAAADYVQCMSKLA